MGRLPLVCFPYAGSGASCFLPWSRLPDLGFEVLAVQLAGREDRCEEEPHTEVAAAVADLLPELEAALDGERRVALFGHSLGAVLAYETAQRLVRDGIAEVARLFVSGSPGPWSGRRERAAGLDGQQFLDRVQELAGYRHPALDHPQLRELILPALRADVVMHESYRPSWPGPLEAPITALRGVDDALVSREQAREWRRATCRDFRLLELPGGHMYLVDSGAGVARALEEELAVGVSR